MVEGFGFSAELSVSGPGFGLWSLYDRDYPVAYGFI